MQESTQASPRLIATMAAAVVAAAIAMFAWFGGGPEDAGAAQGFQTVQQAQQDATPTPEPGSGDGAQARPDGDDCPEDGQGGPGAQSDSSTPDASDL